MPKVGYMTCDPLGGPGLHQDTGLGDSSPTFCVLALEGNQPQAVLAQCVWVAECCFKLLFCVVPHGCDSFLLRWQAVRGSLVGTVEKRGISGGQRKRVNVGLELVMEPSLLILDEPTSGLDSSSSQLLLRALRREALEGVNICMVVHQPSYTLFNMFDDLILLAKGGLTVYHGSVRKVEAYFAGLGIDVPERVNPPDYFIDVLEGLIKPSTSSGLTYKELPIRWMLHNGYPVPPDMQQNSAGLTMSPVPANLDHPVIAATAENDDQSFVGEIWQDVRCNVEHRRDIIRHNFLRKRDLSNRRTPVFSYNTDTSLG
ncbi:unnamed protein product, partial [Ilex paraguariensis]